MCWHRVRAFTTAALSPFFLYCIMTPVWPYLNLHGETFLHPFTFPCSSPSSWLWPLPVPAIPVGKHRSAPRTLGSDPAGRRRSASAAQHKEESEAPAPTFRAKGAAQARPVPECWWKIRVEVLDHGGSAKQGVQTAWAGAQQTAAVGRSGQWVVQPLPCSISISQSCTTRELGGKPGILELYSWCCH